MGSRGNIEVLRMLSRPQNSMTCEGRQPQGPSVHARRSGERQPPPPSQRRDTHHALEAHASTAVGGCAVLEAVNVAVDRVHRYPKPSGALLQQGRVVDALEGAWAGLGC